MDIIVSIVEHSVYLNFAINGDVKATSHEISTNKELQLKRYFHATVVLHTKAILLTFMLYI